MPPIVSLMVPCYNEEKTIRILLDAFLAQTYPLVDMEVVIADGLSEDRTRTEISSFQKAYPDLEVRVVDNHSQTIPAALNTAISASKGEIIVRLDAHSVPNQSYIARSVDNLEAGKGKNVGGVWQIQAGSQVTHS